MQQCTWRRLGPYRLTGLRLSSESMGKHQDQDQDQRRRLVAELAYFKVTLICKLLASTWTMQFQRSKKVASLFYGQAPRLGASAIVKQRADPTAQNPGRRRETLGHRLRASRETLGRRLHFNHPPLVPAASTVFSKNFEQK